MKYLNLFVLAAPLCMACTQSSQPDLQSASNFRITSSRDIAEARYIGLIEGENEVKSGSFTNGTLFTVDAYGEMLKASLDFSFECQDPSAESEIRKWLDEGLEVVASGVDILYGKYAVMHGLAFRIKFNENGEYEGVLPEYSYLISEVYNSIVEKYNGKDTAVVRLSDGKVFFPTLEQFPVLHQSDGRWRTSPDEGQTIYWTDKWTGGNLYMLKHGDGELDTELICSDTGESQLYVVDPSGNIIGYNATGKYSDVNGEYLGGRGDYRIIYRDGKVDSGMTVLPKEYQYRAFFRVGDILYAYVSDGNGSTREEPDRAKTYLYRLDVSGNSMTATLLEVFTQVYLFDPQEIRVQALDDGRFLLGGDCAHQWGIHEYSIICDPKEGTYVLRSFELTAWNSAFSGAPEDGLSYIHHSDRKIYWFNAITMEMGDIAVEYPSHVIWRDKTSSEDYAMDDSEGKDAEFVLRGIKKADGSPVTLLIKASDGTTKLIENIDDRQVTSLVRIN